MTIFHTLINRSQQLKLFIELSNFHHKPNMDMRIAY